MQRIRGRAASGGIVFGKIHFYQRDEQIVKKRRVGNPQLELQRYEYARSTALGELDALYERELKNIGKDHAEIFFIHKMLLEDYGFVEKITDMILGEGVSADYAVHRAANEIASELGHSEDEYIRARTADMLDVSRRLIRHIQNKSENTPVFEKNTILCSYDLEPSETVMLYAAEDDKVSTVISDIVAGCMMYEICLDKAFVRYQKLEPVEGRNKLDFDAFSEYLGTLADSDEFRFKFDVKYVEGKTGETSPSDITNGMIYRQMIAGMLAMLLMLVCFCSCNPVVSEFESGIRSRLKTVGSRKLKGALLEIAALTVYSLPVIVLISVMLFGTAGINGSLRLLLIDLVFTVFCSTVFYLFAYICRSVFVYQLLGTVFLIVSGVTGFVSVFSGFIGTPSFSASPAACYIDAFIKYVLRV